MPEERVELSRGCPRGILSPLRLPFRHSGVVAAIQLSSGTFSRAPSDFAATLRLDPESSTCAGSGDRRSEGRYERWRQPAPVRARRTQVNCRAMSPLLITSIHDVLK